MEAAGKSARETRQTHQAFPEGWRTAAKDHAKRKRWGRSFSSAKCLEATWHHPDRSFNTGGNIMEKNHIKWLGACVVLVSLSPLTAGAQEVDAQENEMPDRFAINIGGSYVYDSDTRFAIRSGNAPIGTSLSFAKDLDGDEQASGPTIFGYYRFDPHHRVDFSYVKFEREGRRRTDRDINFGDRVFSAGSGIDSTITTEGYKLAYTYSFYHDDKVELGASIGALVAAYEIQLENAARTITSDKQFSQPLPELGFRMDYAINPRWHTLFSFDTFYIDYGDKFRGSLDELRLSFEYRASRNVVLGAAANRLSVMAETDDSDFRGFVSDFYRAGQFYVGLRY
jgi:hypothetical protein